MTIGSLYVLVRMKSVELDYKLSTTLKTLDKANVKYKELKAKKASLLSVSNLERFAIENDLHEPNEKQIIIIPE